MTRLSPVLLLAAAIAVSGCRNKPGEDTGGYEEGEVERGRFRYLVVPGGRATVLLSTALQGLQEEEAMTSSAPQARTLTIAASECFGTRSSLMRK